MSLVQKAVRGAAWTTLTSMAARVFSLVATMLVTHKIPPDEWGQTSAAVVVALTANSLSTFFLSNYLIVDPTRSRSAAWHANWIQQLTGMVALGATVLLGPWLGPMLGAPKLAHYLPGAVLAFVVLRVSIVPEKLLVRDLRFRFLALTRMSAEIGYGVVTIVAAYAGMGGMALILGAFTRMALKTVCFCAAVPWREWSEPHAFDATVTKKMFAYGTPLWLSGIAGYVSGNWDNLLVSRYFGPAVMATYGLAFNLAEMPAAQIGEQLCEVLLPSFALLSLEQRRAALVKAVLVVSLITFPIAVGLGAVSDTIVRAFFNARWAAVAPMLLILSLRAVGRTIIYPLTQYLQSIDRNRDQMLLGFLHAGVLVATLVALGARSPMLTCFGVVATQSIVAIFGIVIVGREGVPTFEMSTNLLRILLACATMAGAVFGVRRLLAPYALPPVVLLAVEVTVGAITYVPAAFVLCGGPTRNFLSWLRRGLGRTEAAA